MKTRKLLPAILFGSLLAGIGGTFYFSTSISVIRPLVKITWIAKAIAWKISGEIPNVSAVMVPHPPVNVLCPSHSYEMESFALEVFAPPENRISTPRHFWVKPPAEISVAEDTGLMLIDSKSWHLTPKEQGEYDIVVGGDMPEDIVKHVSVHRIDHLSRRQFTLLSIGASVIAFIGTMITIRNGIRDIKKELAHTEQETTAESVKLQESKVQRAASEGSDIDPTIPPS